MKSAEFRDNTSVWINAGGRASRLQALMRDKGVAAKALLRLPGTAQRLIEYQVDRYRELGFSNIVVGAGSNREVAGFVSDKYRQQHSVEIAMTPLEEGTAGDLVKALRDQKVVQGERVLVVNADTIVDADELSLIRKHTAQPERGLTMLLTRQSGVPNEDAFYVSRDAQIIHSNETGVLPATSLSLLTAERGSSTGMVVVETEALRSFPWQTGSGYLSLYKQVMQRVIEQGLAYAEFLPAGHQMHELGTTESYQAFHR